MGPLIAIGGIHVPSEQVGPLERSIEDYCRSVGFPRDEQFKWSPGKKEAFQKNKLLAEDRITFYEHLLSLAEQHGVTATIVIEDTDFNPARSSSASHEQDATSLFLERTDWSLAKARRDGVVVVASPSGGSKEEDKFLADCLDLLESGTEYMNLCRIALSVFTARSRHIRLLQLADIVASCTVARVSGETNYSPHTFDHIRRLFRSDGNRIGGVGLKIHPDVKYANLYHWLVGDSYRRKGSIGIPLPDASLPYESSPGEATEGYAI
jgi:hypothetical protein